MLEYLDSPIVFEDPGQLLSALVMLTPDRGSLPDNFFFTSDGKWAVGSQTPGFEHIADIARQHGWEVSFSKKLLRGESLPTTAMLNGLWDYCDPLCAAEWAGQTAAPPSDRSWVWLDPSIPRTQFLLAARDEARAQRILDVLAAHHTQGIRGIPILLRPVIGSECPYQFYWNVFLDGPNPFLFEAADSVWWGPCGHGRTQIFLAYPWSIKVAIEVLHRLPWRPDTGVVLLSKSAPAVVELSLTPGGDVFAEFPSLIRLEKGSSKAHCPAVQVQASPETRFTIELRTGGPDPAVAASRRIESLRKEIDAKEQLRKDMEARAGITSHDYDPPEPLFLFAQRAADCGRVPSEIQRLLIEWADQPEDLGAIQYAFIPGDNLLPGIFPPGTSLHAITCSTALGKAGNFSVGARLLDYAPRTDHSWNLDLDAEWAEHDLRLFSPATGHLWLYPNLRPTDVAAGKLAAAILPEPDMRRKDYLFPLLSGYDGNLHFLILRRDAFHPLVEAFRWVLDIDAGISLPAAGSAFRDKVSQAVRETVSSNFYRSVQEEAGSRFNRVASRLKTRADAVKSDLEQRDARLQHLEKASTDYQDAVDQIGASLNKTLTESTTLNDLLNRVEADFGSTRSHLSEIQKTIEKHEALCTSLQELSAKVSEIRGRLANPRRN